jgi:GNAT superfamily N-acetyltransferase
VADGLLAAAETWLRTQGVTAMRGPASPSVNDEYGLLIEGFNHPPAVLMTYNPPYYPSLLERTEEEFLYAAKDLRSIVNKDLVIIAEAKGKPVGFALSLPDLNQILIRNRNGRLLPFLLRYFLNRRKINFVRIVILGVLPEYLNTGIGGVLFQETGERGVRNGFPRGEASWVLEDNVMMNRGAELMNGERYKTYRIYQKELTPGLTP